MSSKIVDGKKPKSYIKCYITDELDSALNTLEGKIGIVRSDVVRAALHEHLKNHYSSYLPKSKSEIENEVKEKHYFEKYKVEFLKQEQMKESIPGMEKYDKELKDRIETDQKKLNKLSNFLKELLSKCTGLDLVLNRLIL